MKVAIVHDDLVQWGGAERMLLVISEIFPDAPIFTSVFDNSNDLLSRKFASKKIVTSFMQKIPGWKSLYKVLLPLYPLAFEQFNFDEYNLVISQTTRFAKSIITKPQTKHVCYLHTPPRFLWKFSGEKNYGKLLPYFSFLRIYDQISARRVDKFLAGSRNCQNRIKTVYSETAEILYPFVDDLFFKQDSFEGDYYLVIARLNGYKRVDLAVKVFNKSKKRLKIIGIGPGLSNLKLIASPNVEFLQNLPEKMVLNLIAGCKGLIITAEEDFGLTSLEAQAMGKGVIAYKKGGSLETVIEGETGIFFEEQSIGSLDNAIERFEDIKFNKAKIIANAKKFNKDKFKKDLLRLIN